MWPAFRRDGEASGWSPLSGAPAQYPLSACSEVETCQAGQSLQVHQSSVRDLRADEFERFETGQNFQVHQICIRDLRDPNGDPCQRTRRVIVKNTPPPPQVARVLRLQPSAKSRNRTPTEQAETAKRKTKNGFTYGPLFELFVSMLFTTCICYLPPADCLLVSVEGYQPSIRDSRVDETDLNNLSRCFVEGQPNCMVDDLTSFNWTCLDEMDFIARHSARYTSFRSSFRHPSRSIYRPRIMTIMTRDATPTIAIIGPNIASPSQPAA